MISTYAIWIDESAVSMELSFVELTIIDDSIREGKSTGAFLPHVFDGTGIRRF